MKKLAYIIIGIFIAVLGHLAFTANAAPTSTVVQNLFITGLSGGGTECLHILNSGLVQTTAGDCGTGGPGGSSTVLYQGYGTTLTPNPINTTGTIAVNTSTLTTFINGFGFTTSTGGGGLATTTPYTVGNLTVASGSALYTYLGSACGGVQFVSGISASGTVTCATPTGGSSSTNVWGTNGVTTTQSGVNATASLNMAFISANWLPSTTVYLATNTGNWAGTWKNYNTTDFLASSTSYVSTNTGNWAGTWKNYTSTDFLASSTAYVANNAGNWAGTWQNVNSSSFYLASNPSNFISTSTGLTVTNFATSSIKQWNNDAGYVTSTGSGNVTFKANGGVFMTSSTVDFQQGTNITITTSSAGVYTITASTASASGTINNASATDVAYYNGTSSISGSNNFTYAAGGGNTSSTNLVIGTSSSYGCTETIDEVNSSTYYYSYWKSGRPFTDTSSCVQ